MNEAEAFLTGKDYSALGNRFYKMSGAGNCFILVHHRGEEDEQLKKLAKSLCNREFGIGADGVLVIYTSDPRLTEENEAGETKGIFHMRVFNADGSFAEMCGNGLRCFAALLVRENMVPNISANDVTKIKISTDSDIKNVQVERGDRPN